ncbi:hypothetical protein HHI36_018303 [Cryptolaemus montrouzieri]|uniref:Uncharacterized protein n=1 Tax=Cryptolaemus montrouzieri TaxID=559131 RepID=A0ABD2P0V3_9CUCU
MVFPLSEENSDNDSKRTSHEDGIMMPPSNANSELTDEDFGDEDKRNWQKTEDKGEGKEELSMDKWRPRSSANRMAIFHRC